MPTPVVQQNIPPRSASAEQVRAPRTLRAAAVLAAPFALLGWLGAAPTGVDTQGSRDERLAAHLARSLGAQVDRATPVHWVARSQGPFASRVQHTWAVVRALPAGAEHHDVFLIAVRLSPEGDLLEAGASYNLSDTSLVDEANLVGDGERVAWTVEDHERVYRVEYADLGGDQLPSDWTPLERVQHRVGNWQQVGQARGVERRSYRLDPAADKASLELLGGVLTIDADGRVTRIALEDGAVIDGQRHVLEQPPVVARPGELVTWAVDRVRALPWFGSDRMQLVKAIAYRAFEWLSPLLPANDDRDWAMLARASVTPNDGPLESAPGTVALDDEGDGVHWPPEPIEPVVSPALEGEGVWRGTTGDPFVHQLDGLPSPFATTFVRPDAEHTDGRVIMVAWDPRQVELHFTAGTREPKSDTGERGEGLIPRDPEHITRLVGAFNSGFQTEHGHWGAMVDGKVFVPPKPFGATIARLSDGAVGFGTWPVSREVPEEIQSFRQNLTPLVADGRINPYNRTWWGGVPDGWKDDTLTIRTALCLTKDGLVTYFYGSRVDHMHLAKAMVMARCDYGVHLDMNAGHTGFEFYSVAKASELSPLPFELDENWQAEGEVPEMRGYRYRSRRLFSAMQLMLFPRYIQRDNRDFFYLIARRLLPGAPLASAFAGEDPSEGRWQVDPSAGFPYAFATTSLRPDPARPETKVRVMKLDLKVVAAEPVPSSDDDASALVSLSLPELSGGARALLLDEGRARLGTPEEGAVALGADVDTPGVRAAWGTVAGEILVYAEVVTAPDPARDRAMLSSLLERIGCGSSVFSADPARLALPGGRDLAGHPVDSAHFAGPERRLLRFVRRPWPAQRRLFTDTPIVPPAAWYALQKYQN